MFSEKEAHYIYMVRMSFACKKDAISKIPLIPIQAEPNFVLGSHMK